MTIGGRVELVTISHAWCSYVIQIGERVTGLRDVR
jgi:hypothetical protein